MILVTLLTIGSLAIGSGTALWWLNHEFFKPYNPGEPERPFIVERGWAIQNVSEELSKQGFTRNGWVIKILGKIKRDKLKVIRSGEYSLSAGMSPKEILQRFIDEEVVYHSMTVPEGFTLAQIRELMVKTTLANEGDVDRALKDRNLLSQLKINSSTFEGYLFPETYKFSRPDNAEIMITTMVKEGEKRKSQELETRARALGYTWHQILIIASIIEKESGNKDPLERRKISSVIHNRLRLKMPLQSDPTVIYGIPNFNGNLTRADLATPSPYNSYMVDGLPPTPICSPGMDSIKAALEPADTDYLYFVSRGDGSSFFSARYKDHREAVQKYQVQPAKAEPAKSELKPEVRSEALDAILGDK